MTLNIEIYEQSYRCFSLHNIHVDVVQTSVTGSLSGIDHSENEPPHPYPNIYSKYSNIIQLDKHTLKL